MALRESWFDIPDNEGDSFKVMILFLTDLPEALNELIDPKTSDLRNYLRDKKIKGLTYEATVSAYNEAKDILLGDMAAIGALPENGHRINILKAILAAEGLSGETLFLKLRLLNALWNNVYMATNNGTNHHLFIGNTIIKRILKKFLDYLNSLLDSILEGVPGVGPLKEIKEAIEGYLDLED